MPRIALILAVLGRTFVCSMLIFAAGDRLVSTASVAQDTTCVAGTAWALCV